MVEIKVDSKEIIFRIVFVGGEEATKFAALRQLHEGLDDNADDLTVIHAGGERIVGFKQDLGGGDRLFGMNVTLHAVTRPGQQHSPANDVLLLGAADAVVFLDDRDPRNESAAKHFGHLLEQLKGLNRRPEELPLFIHCYADGPVNRKKVFRRLSQAWKPAFFMSQDDSIGIIEVFSAAQEQVLKNYKRYESDLAKRGLEGHIKIRDRIYEKVYVGNETGAPTDVNADSREIRLIKNLNQGSQRPFGLARLLMLLVFGASIVAALLVVRAL